jgi:hypothetical protein
MNHESGSPRQFPGKPDLAGDSFWRLVSVQGQDKHQKEPLAH